MKRIFRCIDGHEYESKEPLSAGNGLPIEVKKAVYLFGIIPIWPPRIVYNDKANDTCKLCEGSIISEDCYHKGELIKGAVRMGRFK